MTSLMGASLQSARSPMIRAGRDVCSLPSIPNLNSSSRARKAVQEPAYLDSLTPALAADAVARIAATHRRGRFYRFPVLTTSSGQKRRPQHS